MNILLINHYAGSPRHGMEFRPYYFAREWTRAGHSVKIAASSESHVRSRRPPDRGILTREDIDGIEYLWLRTRSYQGNGAARLLNMAQFTARLYGLAAHLDGWRPDAVIASSTYPYDIWPAARLARRHGARLFYEVHDLWPLTPMLLGGFSRHHPMIASMQWAENYAYRHADAVISMLPCAYAHMERHGLSRDRYVHIPNGVDPAPAPAAADHPDVLRAGAALASLRERCDFVVAYAGAHGHANALDTLLEAMALLRDRPVGLALIGSGPEREALRAQAARLKLERVAFVDPVERGCIPAILEQADAAYIGLRHSPLFAYGVSPNKLFDYMQAARPVVYAIDSGNDIVNEAGCGISIKSQDPAALAQGLEAMRDTPAQERAAMGRRGAEYVQVHHAYPVLARLFLEVMESAAPTGSRPAADSGGPT